MKVRIKDFDRMNKESSGKNPYETTETCLLGILKLIKTRNRDQKLNYL